jgi:hypothetical protein
MSKCPPGVICFENFTFIYVIIAIVVMMYLFYIRQSSINNDKQSQAMNTTSNNNYSQNGIFPRPSYSFSNVQNDVLMNPYTPPLKDERVVMSNDVRGGVPLLPLLGRPLYVGRDKWQYYTMNDSNNQLKLPVSFKSKSCTSEYGCDEISNGDTVYVDGINATFQATIYDNATMRYIPFA